MVQREILFLQTECAAMYVRSTLLLAWSPWHCIMVAVLMLVYQVLLCKIILYLKS